MKIIQFSETADGYAMDSSGYPAYVAQVMHRVPADALAFMSAPWHYAHRDERCPHDARLQKLVVLEFEEEDEGDARANGIEIHLVGAYGNRLLLTYSDVQSYSVEKTKSDWPAGDRSHGDWLIDEMLVLDDDLLSHEIVFTQAVIRIRHRDLQYTVAP
ncbi:hypothetical protein [Variovorax boronicumulans]|uniref:hypothetical protein n=1 Tax=Variovorax boronicumulans TaxID=436515 RepID=UPI0033918543